MARSEQRWRLTTGTAANKAWIYALTFSLLVFLLITAWMFLSLVHPWVGWGRFTRVTLLLLLIDWTIFQAVQKRRKPDVPVWNAPKF